MVRGDPDRRDCRSKAQTLTARRGWRMQLSKELADQLNDTEIDRLVREWSAAAR
jgi:hypothetical protein